MARCEGQHAIGMRRLRRLVGRRPVRVGQRTLRGYSGHCGTHKPFASRHQLECGGGGGNQVTMGAGTKRAGVRRSLLLANVAAPSLLLANVVAPSLFLANVAHHVAHTFAGVPFLAMTQGYSLFTYGCRWRTPSARPSSQSRTSPTTSSAPKLG